MSTPRIKCSQCGATFFMRWPFVKRNFSKYEVKTVQQLSKVYYCHKCRKSTDYMEKFPKKKIESYKRSQPILTPLPLSAEFKGLQKEIQRELNIAIERGINNPVVVTNFVNNTKAILNAQKITQYELLMKDGELFGIRLKEMPLYNTVDLKLNPRGTKRYGA